MSFQGHADCGSSWLQICSSNKLVVVVRPCDSNNNRLVAAVHCGTGDTGDDNI
jgi:hypothetical protein